MNHTLSPPDEWAGGEVSSNHYVDDCKAGRRWKANWPGHLAEIVHSYNATQSGMMGYSPHYLIFGWRPGLPVDFYFSTLRNTEVPKRGTSTKCVDEYTSTVWHWLRAALQEIQVQSMTEDQRQKQYYNWKIGNVGLKTGDFILVKADNFQGKRKIKDRWEDKPHEVVHQIMTDISHMKWNTNTDIHASYIATDSSF